MDDFIMFADNSLDVMLSAVLKASERNRAKLNTIDENGNVIHEATPAPGDAPGGMFAVGQVAPSTTETNDESR